jgi:hypothetical protein
VYLAPALVVIGFVLVIVVIFVGFHWVKPEHLKLKLKWNCLEFELRRAEHAAKPPAIRRERRAKSR